MPALISLVGAVSRGGFSMNCWMRPVRVVNDGAERAGVVDVDEVDRADAALRSVERKHGAQVERGEDVAVEDEERAVDELLDVLERARRAQGRLFDDVAEPQPERASRRRSTT